MSESRHASRKVRYTATVMSGSTKLERNERFGARSQSLKESHPFKLSTRLLLKFASTQADFLLPPSPAPFVVRRI